ncbi:Alpha-ketoglutarate-dependent dioxygenase alkb [Thalictrum thalictroides]|uniref:Alpha-ketoglutarate-dependent dioxygenase alkb n=1 Tax=Thalictrum thalictroides TaxID=46969 RepID=A0A7J6VMX3_THATH|nr:Alpha-ketoglutarate-dependent dioxygenase alkb [Thalictrum thalictroides]
MYESSTQSPNDSERTAFRKAEKKYKLYYETDTKKCSSKRQKQPKPIDLSDVLDFKQVLDGQIPSGIFKLQSDFDFPVYCIETHPGFYFIPAALSIEEQCHWIRESLTSFPQPPNRTNHHAIYGHIHDLFIAAQKTKVLTQVDALDLDPASLQNSDIGTKWHFSGENTTVQKEDSAIPASALLRKLRWSTLGLQFDWSKRNYNVCIPHNKIPESLCQLAKRMAAPAMPTGEDFHPEAAIVNYFAAGDMLGGHLDDMEADWSKPIVSISLGCKAIFLLGGKSRDDLPVAMFLRSGDMVLMAGQARECFHGVPRIFTDKENAEITPLALHFSNQEDLGFLDYIRCSRININIRQVF